MRFSGWTTLKALVCCIGLIGATTLPAAAQKGLDEPFQAAFKKALEGKTVAYIPVAMNFDLTEGWFAGVKKELEPYGMKVIVRDPNWSTNAGAQALTTLISEKPAAIIVHNPDVQTYAKLLQRAENEGIYIIQINMGSNYRSSAFVGANWIEIGERDTEAVVKACKGKSNKIAIVQGALSVQGAVQLINREKGVLVDVREPQEYAAGHPVGARNLPLDQFEARLAGTVKNKGVPLLLICAGGNRASRAAAIAKKLGYEKAQAVAGGLKAWKEANLPLENA